MGFSKGRVSFLRFKVSGSAPRSFEEDHLDRLNDRAIVVVDGKGNVKKRSVTSDGFAFGWGAGRHIRDVGFSPEKNIAGDALLFDFRMDRPKPPTDLLHCYYATDVDALAKGNVSRIPNAKQKREAKESALERLDEEAKDGRYDQRKRIPVMWDRLNNEVLFGSGLGDAEHFLGLFMETFGNELECMTAGPRAFQQSEARGQTRMVDDSAPSAFLPSTPRNFPWIEDESSRDFLGNEFLLWLLYYLGGTDTLKLLDDSEATVMFARSLKLDCPRGQTGHVSLTDEGPAKMKETIAAIRVGKLPREAGLTVVRANQQYEFSIAAETLAIASAKLPFVDEEITDSHERLEARVSQIRHLVETLDLLYDTFGKKRFGREWESELKAMQKWLKGKGD